jgi:hypothetical protein
MTTRPRRTSRVTHARAAGAAVLSPWSGAWRRAIRTAGQCVMADELGLKVTRIEFDPVSGGVVDWSRPSLAYSYFYDAQTARLLGETDALVALAGGVALWLHQPTEVTAEDLREDDTVANSFLLPLTAGAFIAAPWREYLRNRAIAKLHDTETKALIARVASLLIQGNAIPADGLREFLEEAQKFVHTYLEYRRNIADYILLFGLPGFALPVEQLSLRRRVLEALKPAGIKTIGQLVSRAASELEQLPGIGRAELSAVRRAVASRGFELAPRPIRPREFAEPVGFAAEYIYHRDVGESIYEWDRGAYFTRNWPKE